MVALRNDPSGGRALLWRWAAVFALLAAPTAVLALMDGRTVAGAPVWLKPLKFQLSTAVHLATLGFFVAYARASRRAIRTMAWLAIGASIFEVSYIMLKAAQGAPSHFNPSLIGQLMFALMGLGAMILVSCALWLALVIRAEGPQRVWLTSVRLGLGLTFVLGAAAGIVIAARGGPYIDSDLGRLPFFGWSTTGGDLRPAHFLGIHAMQLLPVAGAVIAWAGGGRRLIVATASVYCAVTVAVFALALQGLPLISGGFA